MTFDERNEGWGGHLRGFLQMHSRSGVPRYWAIRVEENRIITRWGQFGGSMQEATEHMNGVNIGKKNEKTPAQYALERARETCRKKNWEGYREAVLHTDGMVSATPDGTPVFWDAPTISDIDFENLPLSLSFYKPDNSMGAGITKKAEAGQVLYARKANGLMYVIARGAGKPKLYSRRMLRQNDNETETQFTWDDRFPHLVEGALKFLPPNSIILGELLMHDAEGNERLDLVGSVTKSLTPQAIEDQKTMGTPKYYCWDIAFWNGQDLVKTAPVKERFDLIHEVLDAPGFIPVQYYDSTIFPNPAAAVEHAKKNKFEGWVVVVPDGIYGDKGYNYKGKPDRPGSVCAKLKPTYEDDFVALWDPEKGWGERSTKARNNQGIKCVSLWQYNTKGELIYISDVSSGLEDDQKRDWANAALYPQVWKIKYNDRRYMSQGEDTNAMDFASFLEVRTDKKPEECVNPEL